jgi:hypothetical protein
MTDNITIKPCPCCGGEARVQFEVYGTWMRIYCVDCGLSTMSVPASQFDEARVQQLADELWNKRHKA